MPSASSARLKGDDYQHLYTWYRVLALRKPGMKVNRVSIEMPGVGALDDAVVHLTLDSGSRSEFCQIKFHVDHRSQYSTDVLLAKQGTQRSLLEKLFEGWRAISQLCDQHVVVFLSNWGWDPADPIARLIDGRTCRIKNEFLSSSGGSEIGMCRHRWIDHLGADPVEFARFIDSLRIQIGYSHERKLLEDIEERMDAIGLRSDESAILIGLQQVREWVKDGVVTIDDDILGQAIERHGLRAEQPERSAVVHLHTIVHRAFADEADYVLDWVELFEDKGNGQRGHLPTQADGWQTAMLPELQELRRSLDAVPDLRLLRMRGQARLSAWLAAGFMFRQTAGYEIEAKQGPLVCRTDVPPSTDWVMCNPHRIEELGDGPDVAVGVSVSADLTEEVLRYLRNNEPNYGAVMFLQPDRPLGREAIRSAVDMAALAGTVKQATQQFVRQRRAKRLGLFYAGPAVGALFIGHALNAVSREIQVFEDADPGYAPSFLLS